MEKSKRTQERIDKVVYADTSQESNKAYEEWAEFYDGDVEVLNRGGPEEVALEVLKHINNDKLTTLLDVGAGTGISAEALKKHGFIGIMDAVDYSAPMLQVAQRKSIYRYHIHFGVTPYASMPVEDNSYDCMISVGAFLPNHITPGCLVPMLRALKSSGILVFNSRANDANSDYLKGLENVLQDLKNKGVIEFTQREIVYHGNSEKEGVMKGFLYRCKKMK